MTEFSLKVTIFTNGQTISFNSDPPTKEAQEKLVTRLRKAAFGKTGEGITVGDDIHHIIGVDAMKSAAIRIEGYTPPKD